MKIFEVPAGAGVPTDVSALGKASFELDGADAGRLPGLVWEDAPGGERVRLVAREGDLLAGIIIGCVVAGVGFIDLLVVAPEFRRRGIASELIARWESRARELGATSLSIGANLHAYAWFGVDIRYTPAVATFLHAGYVRQNVLFNMDVDLSQVAVPTGAEMSRLEEAGVTVRRGTADDADALARHNAKEWSEAWARETQIALGRSTPTIFLAFAQGEVIGFAAHSVFRGNYFGPLGTTPSWRRIGLGGVLTRLALVDMAARGHQVGEIGWVNEAAIPFYARCSNARLGRTFWTMTRKGTERAV